MCWCVGGQTANMAEKGVAVSGNGTEYAWQIRTVSTYRGGLNARRQSPIQLSLLSRSY